MKRLFGGFLIIVLVLLATVTVLFSTHQRLPLGFLTAPAAKLLSSLTGSEIEIEGNYYLTLGRWLVVSVDSGAAVVTGDDGPGFSAAIKTFEATVHLQSLFKKQLVLDGVTLSGMNLDLHPGKEEKNQKQPQEKNSGFPYPVIPSLLKSTGEITLSDIVIRVFQAEREIPVQYHLTKGTGNFGAESPGQLTIDGVVDSIAFNVSIAAGPLTNLSDEMVPWPFAIDLGHKSIAGSLRGQVDTQEGGPAVEAEFSVAGDHWDDLASLYGSEGATDTPFAAEGSFRLTAGEAKLQISKLKPGSTNLTITGVVKDYGLPEKHYSLKATGESLDLDLLHGLINRPKGSKQDKSKNQAANTTGRDTVLLPEAYPFRSLELDLDLQQLTVAAKPVADFHLNAVIDHGDIEKATFSAVLKNSSLTGDFSVREKEGLPRVKARLNSESFDVGTFLKDFHLAESVEMQIAEMSSDLSTKGRTAGELIDNLEFTTTAKDGIYILDDSNTGGKLPINLHHSTITAAPDTGLQFHLQGEVRNSPIDLQAHFEHRIRSQAAEGDGEVSFSSVITLEAGRIEFNGKVPLPVRKEGMRLSSRLTCEQLSGFNKLLNLKLPGIGPLALAGTFEIVPEGYRLQGVELDVGTSSLDGDLTFDTATEIPELTANLRADNIQLDDLRDQRKQPEKVLPTAGAALSQKDSQDRDKKVKKRKNLTDREVLAKFNAKIDIEVSDVYSGKDHLGRGRLRIEQQNGKLEIMPLHLDLDGGGIELYFSVEPDDELQRYTLNMEIADLDYGAVGRWFQPDTDLKGVFNLRTSLEAKSPDFQSIMAGARGYLDFYVHPEQFRTGVIDLWAVNFFYYMIPLFTPKNESVINCVAGRFNIEDGLLNQEELLIDTTRIQVAGTVFVDFTKNTIDAAFRPVPKRPQFFSLATPLEVNGKLSDFRAGVPSGALIGTVIRQVSSAVVVPLQMIFKKNVPKDGTAYCVKLFEKRPLETMSENQGTLLQETKR